MKNWIENKIYTFFPQTREEDLYIRLGYELLFGALIIMFAHFYLSLIPQIQDVLPIKMFVITCLTIFFVTKFIQIFADELPIIIIISYFIFIFICITITIFNIEMPNAFENHAGGWTELANRKTVGTIFSAEGQRCIDGLSLTDGQTQTYNSANAHFKREAYNSDFPPNFEPTQRAQMWKRTEDLNQYFRNPELIIAELKFRHTIFQTDFRICKYCDDLHLNYTFMPVIVDVDNKITYYQLLNYLKECPHPHNEFFCFPQKDLNLLYVREQLDSFKVKDKFSHIIIRDVSFYHNTATEQQLAVGESMRVPLSTA